jgi:hypothetical protein
LKKEMLDNLGKIKKEQKAKKSIKLSKAEDAACLAVEEAKKC